MANEPKRGDVVRITTRHGFAYAQVSHLHKFFGCLLRVLDGIFGPDQDTPDVSKMPELYHTYVFPQDLNIPGYVVIVCNQRLRQEFDQHPLMRDGLRDPATGKVKTWWLWDGEKEWRIGALPDNMCKLSLREIWNYKILIDRVENGWRPCDET